MLPLMTTCVNHAYTYEMSNYFLCYLCKAKEHFKIDYYLQDQSVKGKFQLG